MKVVSLNLRVSTVHVHDEISEVSLLSWSPFSSHISSLTSSTKPTLLITLTYHNEFLDLFSDSLKLKWPQFTSHIS